MENVYDILWLICSLMTNTLFLSKPRHAVKIEDTSYDMYDMYDLYLKNFYKHIPTIFNFTNMCLNLNQITLKDQVIQILFSSFP